MRLVISNSMVTWGGGENWSLTVARGLADRGHRVLLVCRPGSELERRALESPRGVEIRTLRLRGDLNPVAVLRAFVLFRREGVRLVCCNRDREVRSLGLAARMAGGVAFVRRRGSDYGFKNRMRFRLTYRYLVDGVMVNSEATRESILSKNPWMPPRKLRRIYNGIPLEEFYADPGLRESARRDLGYREEDLVVGAVGTILPRKRHLLLLRAVSALAEELPRIRLLVVGASKSPELLARLRRETAERSMADRVLMVGEVNDTNPYYNAMDVLAMPSVNEGFGYAAAEAMAVGLPVVVADASSLPEVVDGAGLIVPSDDQRALERAIGRLADSPRLRRELGEKGRRRVEERFSLQRMIGDVESFFHELCTEG